MGPCERRLQPPRDRQATGTGLHHEAVRHPGRRRRARTRCPSTYNGHHDRPALWAAVVLVPTAAPCTCAFATPPRTESSRAHYAGSSRAPGIGHDGGQGREAAHVGGMRWGGALIDRIFLDQACSGDR